MSDLVPIHPRALIRHAVVRVLTKNPGTAALLGERVFPNRMEQWWQSELPACGVYTLSEEWLDTDSYPEPEERRLDLACELLCAADEKTDDSLDALCLAVERAMLLPAIGAAMGDILDESRVNVGLDPLGPGQRKALDETLLQLASRGTELGIAVDDAERQTGVAALNFSLDYRRLILPGDLPDFLLGVSGWDVQPADGHIDMESRVEFAATVGESSSLMDGDSTDEPANKE